MTLQQTFNNATGQNQALVQDGEYTAESVNGPREALTKDTKLKLSQIKRDEVTDKTYKIGEISQKTGLQKQPDGSWAPPKGGAKPAAKKGTAPDFKIGSDVKVKVNGGRPGKITEIRGDVVTVEMPAQGKLPARRDQYYKSDLEAAETKSAAKKEATKGEGRPLKHSGYPDQTPEENLQAWENSVKTEARTLGENQVLLQNDVGDVTFYSESNSAGIEKAESKGFKKMSLVRPDGSVKRHQGNNPAAKKEAETKKKGPALSKVSHFELDMARNQMNTTPDEDRMLDNFVTEMHEDRTSLEEIIKRQDGIFKRNEGIYPKEEKVYKSLREKIINHFLEAEK